MRGKIWEFYISHYDLAAKFSQLNYPFKIFTCKIGKAKFDHLTVKKTLVVQVVVVVGWSKSHFMSCGICHPACKNCKNYYCEKLNEFPAVDPFPLNTIAQKRIILI